MLSLHDLLEEHQQTLSKGARTSSSRWFISLVHLWHARINRGFEWVRSNWEPLHNSCPEHEQEILCSILAVVPSKCLWIAHNWSQMLPQHLIHIFESALMHHWSLNASFMSCSESNSRLECNSCCHTPAYIRDLLKLCVNGGSLVRVFLMVPCDWSLFKAN